MGLAFWISYLVCMKGGTPDFLIFILIYRLTLDVLYYIILSRLLNKKYLWRYNVNNGLCKILYNIDNNIIISRGVCRSNAMIQLFKRLKCFFNKANCVLALVDVYPDSTLRKFRCEICKRVRYEFNVRE